MAKATKKDIPQNALVIVESPTKAKTIRKFLPKSFTVEASMGHVRDLPQSATDVPAALKKTDWARLGVNVEDSFSPLYIVPKDKAKIVALLRKKIKEADVLYLATDEDREGESISWHLLELLKPKIPVKRMVFHEITKAAIERALTETRDVDDKLVRAQETRRILDRLVGFTLSPLIWKKIAFGLSAGRVQSVGLRLIVERERQRLKFQKAQYWDLAAEVEKTGEVFPAKLISVDGTRIASGKDFDENTGKLKADSKVKVLEQAAAQSLSEKLKRATWTVKSVEEKPFSSKPSAPFITSTLQQEANRKLGFSSRETMRTAQSLYENGLITYMRTDSPNLSQEALKAARDAVESLYGKEFLSPEVRQFSSKKGAQEAHEAIRPAGSEFVMPKDTGLSGRDLALYEMIWMRTVATQMAEAKKLSVSVRIEAEGNLFSASGTRILFPGFIRAYVEGSDDPDAALEDKEVVLPNLKENDKLKLNQVDAVPHETKPPARFTEALLVQTLEKEGIGRPSTYASIIDTIIARAYVRKVGNALVPTFTGFVVTQLLEKNFSHLVDPAFTSKMEASLDEIAGGNLEWLPYLKSFYLGKNGLKEVVASREKKIDPDESRTVDIHHVKGVQIKVGRYGAYIIKESDEKKKASEEIHASIPEDIAPADLSSENIEDLILIQERGPQPIGQHPVTKENIYCLTGRYGPYVQQGEVTEAQPKPRRASLLKGMEAKNLTIEQALKLLSLPRELGQHPKLNKPILANMGRFGPYVVCEKDYRSLKKEDDVYTVGLERAIELLSAEKKGRGSSSLIKDLGPHPTDQKPIGVYNGKYGLYVKHGTINATLPKEMNVEKLELSEAVALLAQKSPQKTAKKSSKKNA